MMHATVRCIALLAKFGKQNNADHCVRIKQLADVELGFMKQVESSGGVSKPRPQLT